MKTPIQRAEEAQVAFVALILSGPNQITSERVNGALQSVISTAELTVHDTRNMSPCRQKLLAERQPRLITALNKRVWAKLMSSYPLGGVWPIVERFVKRHLHVRLLNVADAYVAAKVLRRAA